MTFTALVAGLTWVGFEFPADGQPNLWYGVRVLGVPGQYLFLAGLAVLVAPYLAATRPVSLPSRLRSVGLWRWTVVAWVALLFSLVWGILAGAPELFADWRNLAVLAVVAAGATRYLASKPWREMVLVDLAIAYGLLALVPLAGWATGGGFHLLGVRIPLFYGPALYLASFSALVLVEMWTSGLHWASRGYAAALKIATASSLLLVMLSFRRTYWLLLGLGIAVIAYRRARDRSMSVPRVAGLAGLAVLAVVAVFSLLGSEVVLERVESFLPDAETRFAATNEDHLGDLADAFDVIMVNPITGRGIGSYYETVRISEWKEESFEVHNTVLHVWLKFGLLGVVAFLGFHARWIFAMLRASLDRGLGRKALAGGGIYLAAELIATTFATWPYGSFQLTIHHAILLAAVLAVAPAYRARERFAGLRTTARV